MNLFLKGLMTFVEYEAITEKIKEKGVTISSMLLKFENAIFLFFFDGEKVRLGTFSMAIFSELGTNSSTIIGDKFAMMSRFLAERIATISRKISFVSCSIRALSENEAAPILAKLTKKLVERTEL